MSGDLYRQYRKAYRNAGRGAHLGRLGHSGGSGPKLIAVLAAAGILAAGGTGAGAVIIHHDHQRAVSCAHPAGNVALGQCLAGPYGWGGGQQWICLDELWDRESGWSNTAENPSDAYGIAQALGHGPTNQYPAGPANPPVSSARAQIRWGLGYIASTYETPCGAWDHEEADGWY